MSRGAGEAEPLAAWGVDNLAATTAFVAAEAAVGWHEAVQDAQASFLTTVPSTGWWDFKAYCDMPFARGRRFTTHA